MLSMRCSVLLFFQWAISGRWGDFRALRIRARRVEAKKTAGKGRIGGIIHQLLHWGWRSDSFRPSLASLLLYPIGLKGPLCESICARIRRSSPFSDGSFNRRMRR